MARKEPRFLSRRLAETIHLDQLRQHGGSPGLRDEGLLESALARPRNRRNYEPDADLAALAASLAFGLVKNHPFVDGNKRVAFSALFTFLGMNDTDLIAPESDAVRMVLSVAASEVDEAGLAAWIRENSGKAPVRRRRTGQQER